MGVRVREYFGSHGKGSRSISGINITVQGFEELVAAFRELPDHVNKVRRIKAVQKRAAKIYMNTVKGLALTKGGSRRLGQHYKWKNLKSSPKWIDSVYGPDHKSGTEDLTWAGLAGILEGGTKERRGGRGKVEAREFTTLAWERTKNFVEREYKDGLKKTMEGGVKKAGLQKVYKKR